jgi:hypothetical protein
MKIGFGDGLRQFCRDIVNGVRGDGGGAEGGCHEDGEDMVHGLSCLFLWACLGEVGCLLINNVKKN